MRRRVVFLIPLILCLLGVAAAIGLEINSGLPAKIHPNGTAANFKWAVSKDNRLALPTSATIYTYDGSACYFLRVGVDGGWIKLPADNSILLPADGAYASGDSFYISVLVAGHADTVAALGWR